jgi:hypothetical protein
MQTLASQASEMVQMSICHHQDRYKGLFRQSPNQSVYDLFVSQTYLHQAHSMDLGASRRSSRMAARSKAGVGSRTDFPNVSKTSTVH